MARVEKVKQVATGKTLADIAQDRATLDEFVTEHEGELTPELEALFADHEMERTAKVERVGYIITDEEAQIDVIEAQMARLRARKAAAEKRVDWLKHGYLAPLLMQMGMEPGDKVKGALATVRLQLNNPRLDGEIGPAEIAVMQKHAEMSRFVREETIVVVDRAGLLNAAKQDEGLLPEGIRVVRDISVRVA